MSWSEYKLEPFPLAALDYILIIDTCINGLGMLNVHTTLLTEWRDCKDSIHWIVCVSHSVDPIHEYCLLWVFGCNCVSASGKHFSQGLFWATS